MKPINLKLKNFKQHKSLDVDFAEGMTLITGDIGSGKSTILEAISVGLWGSSAVKSKAVELVNDNATNYEIELLLDTGHLIKRDIKNASVELNGEIVVNSHTAVNKYIEELLGVDRKTFLLINVARQKKTAELLDMEGTELNKFLEGITGVDKLDNIITKASNIGRNCKSKAEGFFESLLEASIKEALEFDKNHYIDTIRFAENILEDLKKDAAEIIFDVRKLEKILTEEEALHKAYAAFVESNQKLLAEIAIAKAELEKLSYTDTPDLQAEIKELEAIKQWNIQTIRESERLASQLVKIKGMISSTEDSLNVLMSDRSTDVTPNPEKVNFFKTELALTKAKIAEVTEALDSSICKSCNRPFDSDPEHKQKLENELSELQDKLDRIKIDGKTAASQLDLETKQHEQYIAWSKNVNRLEEALVRYKDEFMTVEVELKNLGSTKEFDQEILDRKHDELNSANLDNNSYNSWKTRLDKASKQFDSLNVMDEPIGDLDSIRASIKKLNTTLSATRDEIQTNELTLYDLKDKLKDTESKLTAHTENESKYVELINKADVYNSLAKVIKDNRTDYITSAWDQILITASEFINTVSSGKISEVVLTEDGLSYRQGDYVRSASLLSGGQSDLVGLGIRIGILQIAPNNFDCVLLDEVSSALDEDASVTLLSIVRNYCNNSIIVSHRAFDCADSQIRL